MSALGFTDSELAAIRADFPILARSVRGGKPLTYLDSGATSQKPQVVLDAELDFYTSRNAAVHRGAHYLAEQATAAFEEARQQVARFVKCAPDELVWVPGATAGINLVAYGIANASLGRGGASAQRFALSPGDQIVLSVAEHHANLVPWQELAMRTGAELRWFEVTDDGRIDVQAVDRVITDRTRVVAVTHASNVTGAITDLAPIVARAHAVGAVVVLDACQSVPHFPVDFPSLGIDFAVFSGHKLLGPTGVGALYGRRSLLEALPPVMFGGSMIEVVTMTESSYLPPPHRFEAGTQMVAQAIGCGAAVMYLSELGMDQVFAHEQALLRSMLAIGEIPGVRVIGPTDTENRLAVVSWTVDGVHAHDVGQVLDDAGIAVRVGHHCAQPLHRRFGLAATTRASASVYTTEAEIVRLHEALSGVRAFFGAE